MFVNSFVFLPNSEKIDFFEVAFYGMQVDKFDSVKIFLADFFDFNRSVIYEKHLIIVENARFTRHFTAARRINITKL